MNYLINFNKMNWEMPNPGIRQKTYIKGTKKLRLVEFTEEFFEENWCTNGHIGYVLEGNITIDFNGKNEKFMKGDGLFIPKGEENKHKGKINKGERALIILFEEL